METNQIEPTLNKIDLLSLIVDVEIFDKTLYTKPLSEIVGIGGTYNTLFELELPMGIRKTVQIDCERNSIPEKRLEHLLTDGRFTDSDISEHQYPVGQIGNQTIYANELDTTPKYNVNYLSAKEMGIKDICPITPEEFESVFESICQEFHYGGGCENTKIKDVGEYWEITCDIEHNNWGKYDKVEHEFSLYKSPYKLVWESVGDSPYEGGDVDFRFPEAILEKIKNIKYDK